jgi:hypothetical protein
MSTVDKILKTAESLIRQKIGVYTDYKGKGRQQIYIDISEIYYLKSYYEQLKVYTFDNVFFLTRGISENLKLLQRFENFVQTHRSYIVNLDFVDTVAYKPEEIGDYTLTLLNKAKVPATKTYEKKIKDYFNIKSLEHVVPYNELVEILKKENIKNYEKDIRMWNKKDLLKEFSYSSGEFNVTLLFKNIIWQSYRKILSGELDISEGNIRSYWYSHLKSVLTKVGVSDENHYNTEIDVFVEFINKYKLFKYSDFNFIDEREHLSNIGEENPHVILFAEKAGMVKTLEFLNYEYGVNTLCLGGQASHLSTEYFIEKLKNVCDIENTEFRVFSFTDYDPAGYSIKNNFINLLKMHKLKVVEHDLMQLKHFTKKEIKNFKYSLSQNTQAQKTIVKRWIKATGGIDNEAYGLELDSMPRDRFKEIFIKESKPYLKKERYKKPKFDRVQTLFEKMMFVIKKGNKLNREEIKRQLLDIIDEFLI